MFDSIYACTADRIFDGHQIHANCAVVVNGSIITGLIPIADLPVNIPVIHHAGCTIIPGLIDAHIHFMRWQGPAFLAYGVTSVRDTGNDLKWILDRREEAKTQPWPWIISLGSILDGPNPCHKFVSERCENSTAAVNAVLKVLDAGADGIKLYTGLSPDWLPAMVQQCHEYGFLASIHCGRSGLRAAMVSKVDEFFHLDGVLADIWPGGQPPGWLEAWGDPGMGITKDQQLYLADDICHAGIIVTPTLAYWDSQWRIRTREAHSLVSDFVPSLISRWQSSCQDQDTADKWLRALDAAQRFIALLIELKVPILAGTDVPCGAVPPGLSLWKELYLLNECGMSPLQILRAATVDAASFMRRYELGRLSMGAVADMVVVRGNPLDTIPQYPDIVRIIHVGIQYEPAQLLKQMERIEDYSIYAADPWKLQLEWQYQRLHQQAP